MSQPLRQSLGRGSGMGLVLPDVMVGRWRPPGGPAVSMVLTSPLHRRCTSGRNRSIPTILAGRTDGGIVDVSAVDTGLPAASAQRDFRGAAQRPHPRSRSPSPYLALARARRPGFDAVSSPGLLRGGLLHEDRDLLPRGCAYCTSSPPTRSTPSPPRVAPDFRAIPRGSASEPHRKAAYVRRGGRPRGPAVNDADAAASRVGCCGVGGRLDGVEGGVQPRVTWRARGSPGGGSAWWRSAGGSP